MRDRRTLIVIVLVLLASAVTVAQKPTQPMGWEAFLTWISSSAGVVAVVSFIESFVIERYFGDWFHNLEDKWKQLIFGGVSIFIPVLGTALGVWTVGWVASWELFWGAIQVGAFAFLSGTIFHGFVPIKVDRA